MICWKIPKSIVFNCEHTYPGLWAFAKIYPVIKHKGGNWINSNFDAGCCTTGLNIDVSIGSQVSLD